MILTRVHRIFGGLARARMPLACGPRVLHLSFRDRERELSPVHAVRGSLHTSACALPSRKLELLSWGFPKTPLHRDPDRASTPGWLPTLRLEDASLELVPSLPFLPASTASSARPPQVCCTLHPIMGFGPFRVNDAEHAFRRFQPRLPSPEPRFTPFRAFFLVRSRTASPRPLPPRRFDGSNAPKCEVPFRPRGLAPPTSPVSHPGVAAATDP